MELSLGGRITPKPRTMRRGAITAFVDRHLLAWEGVMAALAVVYLALGLLSDDDRGPSAGVLVALGGVFIAEFAVRCWDAPSRMRYLREHWIDIVSCLPMIGGLRSIRLVRVFRVCALRRTLAVSHHAAERRHGHTAWFVVPSLCMVWLGSASAYWILEHGHSHGPRTFLAALSWAFVTATSVGSGASHPLDTAAGQGLAALLAIVGIGLVGFVSSQITARVLHQSDQNATLLEEVRSLRSELRAIHELLAQTD